MQLAPPNRFQVVFFPDYRAANPYQALLYRALEPAVLAEPGTVADALAMRARASQPPPVFHLHWDDELTRSQDAAEAQAAVSGFLDAAVAFREAGGRVIWTLHNLDTNHGRNSDLTDMLRERLVELADIVHVHSLPALAAVRRRLAIPPWKLRVVAHGDYAAFYPRSEREAARAALGLAGRRMVIVLPGRIASYKDSDALIDAFLDCATADDTLAIVGFIAEMPDRARSSADSRIVLRGGFAAAADLAAWISAADIVALPYRRSLTSGSAILAASLGRGVLGTRTPGLEDAVLEGRTGQLYDRSDPAAVRASLAAALDEGPDVWAARGQAAWEMSRARDWRVIGHQWLDVLRALGAQMPAGPLLEIA